MVVQIGFVRNTWSEYITTQLMVRELVDNDKKYVASDCFSTHRMLLKLKWLAAVAIPADALLWSLLECNYHSWSRCENAMNEWVDGYAYVRHPTAHHHSSQVCHCLVPQWSVRMSITKPGGCGFFRISFRLEIDAIIRDFEALERRQVWKRVGLFRICRIRRQFNGGMDKLMFKFWETFLMKFLVKYLVKSIANYKIIHGGYAGEIFRILIYVWKKFPEMSEGGLPETFQTIPL